MAHAQYIVRYDMPGANESLTVQIELDGTGYPDQLDQARACARRGLRESLNDIIAAWSLVSRDREGS